MWPFPYRGGSHSGPLCWGRVVTCVYTAMYLTQGGVVYYFSCLFIRAQFGKWPKGEWYFTRILPKESTRYIWNTYQIHKDTCILRASLVPHWIHIEIHQDTCTCILNCSSRYITIHRDTKSWYMYLIRDECGIQSESHTSNVSREVRIWDARYIQDTFGKHVSAEVIKIHTGYIWDTLWDASQKCIQRETYLLWMRHAGYMQDTCVIHVS